MKTSDILLTFFIIVIFIGIYSFNIFTVGIENIKKNWPQYRCNPTVMPFASWFGQDPAKNFTYCIQNMQTSYMGHLLKPTNHMFGLITKSISGLMNSLQSFREKISSLVSNITNVIKSIMGVFINILIQFQYILIKIKDTIGKLLGISATLIYMIDGTYKTGKSIWDGPVGGTMRFICFHPDTPMKLIDGSFKKMCELEIGDILENNRKVEATMKMSSNEENPYYSIYSKVLNQNLYVTGHHLIRDPNTNQMIYVKDYDKSILCDNIKTEFVNCIVTDDHLVNIGEYTFWDWED
jgi:hypothetical protein